MTPSYSVEVDASRDLVRITLSGFFNPADVNRFVEARDDAHRQLRCGKNEHLTLVDIREMQIQSQDIVEAFATMLSKPESEHNRQLVSPNMLNDLLMTAHGPVCIMHLRKASA